MNRQYPLSADEKQKREEERAEAERAQKLSNNRMGVLVFQVSWIMAFVALLVSYWQLGFSPGWRPSADLAPNPILPTLGTLVILASGWFARRGVQIVSETDPMPQADDTPPFRQTWLFAIVTGIAFTLVMVQQYFVIPFGDAPEVRFGMIYRLMIGYHAIHAIVTLVMMWQVYRLSADHRYNSENVWAVEGSAKLWYFVIVAWLMFYVVLYLPFLL
ncbi:MAG: cytochrome c oxidase subunit 3 [Chloroflexota bacterium]